MPTENQPSGRSGEHETQTAKMLHTKPKGVILSIKPTTEPMAREMLGEANRLDADQEVIDHFASEVRRLK